MEMENVNNIFSEINKAITTSNDKSHEMVISVKDSTDCIVENTMMSISPPIDMTSSGSMDMITLFTDSAVPMETTNINLSRMETGTPITAAAETNNEMSHNSSSSNSNSNNNSNSCTNNNNNNNIIETFVDKTFGDYNDNFVLQRPMPVYGHIMTADQPQPVSLFYDQKNVGDSPWCQKTACSTNEYETPLKLDMFGGKTSDQQQQQPPPPSNAEYTFSSNTMSDVQSECHEYEDADQPMYQNPSLTYSNESINRNFELSNEDDEQKKETLSDVTELNRTSAHHLLKHHHHHHHHHRHHSREQHGYYHKYDSLSTAKTTTTTNLLTIASRRLYELVSGGGTCSPSDHDDGQSMGAVSDTSLSCKAPPEKNSELNCPQKFASGSQQDQAPVLLSNENATTVRSATTPVVFLCRPQESRILLHLSINLIKTYEVINEMYYSKKRRRNVDNVSSSDDSAHHDSKVCSCGSGDSDNAGHKSSSGHVTEYFSPKDKIKSDSICSSCRPSGEQQFQYQNQSQSQSQSQSQQQQQQQHYHPHYHTDKKQTQQHGSCSLPHTASQHHHLHSHPHEYHCTPLQHHCHHHHHCCTRQQQLQQQPQQQQQQQLPQLPQLPTQQQQQQQQQQPIMHVQHTTDYESLAKIGDCTNCSKQKLSSDSQNQMEGALSGKKKNHKHFHHYHHHHHHHRRHSKGSRTERYVSSEEHPKCVHCHSTSSSASAKEHLVKPGEVWMNRYSMDLLIGTGSFGQVVRAKDLITAEHVAIKIIRNRRSFVQQAETEIRLLRMLAKYQEDQDAMSVQHWGANCIVRLKSHFMYRGHLCLVFELLTYSLYDLLRNTGFSGVSLTLTRKFGLQLCSALHFLGQSSIQIVHCDLKPENVLLVHPRRSAIKLVDFGSSCRLNERLYMYIQSRFYRAPEVLLYLPYSMSIDMWSLGCVLVELHTGQPLFVGQYEHEQILRIIEVIGMPPDHMICTSKRANKYFMESDISSPSATLNSRYEPKVFRNRDGKRIPFEGIGQRKLVDILGADCGGPSGRRKEEPGHSPQDYSRFIDLVSRMLIIDPRHRITPDEALKHPFFCHSSSHSNNPTKTSELDSPS